MGPSSDVQQDFQVSETSVIPLKSSDVCPTAAHSAVWLECATCACQQRITRCGWLHVLAAQLPIIVDFRHALCHATECCDMA